MGDFLDGPLEPGLAAATGTGQDELCWGWTEARKWGELGDEQCPCRLWGEVSLEGLHQAL